MGLKTSFVILSTVLGTLSADSPTKIDLQSGWKADMGWEVTCTWNLLANDSLQSVRLYNNDRQFMIYRPEAHGNSLRQDFNTPTNKLEVNCVEISEKGVQGKCVITSELYQPPVEDNSYTCEASGEGPYFRVGMKTIEVPAFVAPSEATIDGSRHQSTGRVTLNCTAAGIPAPILTWTVGEQKVPQDHSGKHWNMTSKLWHAWSSFSYTPQDGLPAACTPEASSNGLVFRRQPVTYSSAICIEVAARIIVTLLVSILLAR